MAPDQVPVAAGADADWLGVICPYLLSDDGTYRSTQPDETHRCTAQEPDGALPLAFQERFCLSDRHVRCEVYKYAQESRAAALEEGGVPAEQVRSARFKPAVRTVPVAVGGPSAAEARAVPAFRRPAVVGALALGALLIIVFVTMLLAGGDRGGDGPAVAGAGSSPAAGASAAPAATDDLANETTPPVTAAPTETPDAGASPGGGSAATGGEQLISYRVQEGEALLKIADTFGTSRRRIIQSNEGMADKKPYVVPGDVIFVPATSEMTIEELESVAGFLGLADQ